MVIIATAVAAPAGTEAVTTTTVAVAEAAAAVATTGGTSKVLLYPTGTGCWRRDSFHQNLVWKGSSRI